VFTELQEAYVVTLKPGDVLFVPHHWWHYVENIGVAVSVNSWIPLVIIVCMCIKNCVAQSFPSKEDSSLDGQEISCLY